MRCSVPLERLGRFPFYHAARGRRRRPGDRDGEQRLYANLLLTIGVVSPDAAQAPRSRRRPPTTRPRGTPNGRQHSGRFVGEWPRIGIRPAVDGRQHGVSRSMRRRGRWPCARRTSSGAISGIRMGLPSGRARPQHRRGVRGGQGRRAVPRGRRGLDHDHAVLVLRVRDDGQGPLTPKAVWGFNGTEWPGAVYLAAVLAAHTQKGLPAFGIYGARRQDAGDGVIPTDVQDKLLRFARGGLATAIVRGKSYLSLGGVSMGIAGSVDQSFFERYLGMRVETVDMSEYARRMEEGIYDPVEFDAALAWARTNCREGADRNPADKAKGRGDWTRLGGRRPHGAHHTDLLVGNPRLAELGFGEESLGRNAILGGFQGQRQWTDHSPNGDFMEAILNSSFDGGVRAPHLATENDSLNGATMSDVPAHQPGLRRCADVLERGGGRAGHGPPTGGPDSRRVHPHSGAATLDATGEDAAGAPAMKPFWEIETMSRRRSRRRRGTRRTGATSEAVGSHRSSFRAAGCRSRWRGSTSVGDGAGAPDRGRLDRRPAERVHDVLDQRTDPTWPTHWFVPRQRGTVRSGTCTRSWPTGPRTTARSATVTSVRT